MTRVEALRAMVLREDADPKRARAVALQPLQRGIEQAPAPTTVLDRAVQLQAFALAVFRRPVRMRQAAGAGQRLAARPAPLLHHPSGEAGADPGPRARLGGKGLR